MLCRDCTRRARKAGYCTLHYPKKCKCGNISSTECASCTKDTRRSKRKKVYEMHMKQKLCSSGIDDFVHNKKLVGTNISPDFLWERDAYFLVLEVDEYGHRSYDPEDEEKRMQLISVKLKKRVIFIRFRMPCEESDLHSCIDLVANVLQDMQDTYTESVFIHVREFFGGERC